MGSGYMGEDWASAALDLVMCGKVLGKSEYTKAALKYLRALVEDNLVVGDKKGGLSAARADNGYAIRNRGFLACIAFDWLHDDPEMTPALRAELIGQFHAFVVDYKKDGYRREEPWSNHFLGYFGAAAMCGVAGEGDDPKASELRRIAHELWTNIIVPGYKARLVGGDYPEGWQYARLAGAALGLYVDAEGWAAAGGPLAVAAELPWLRESIAFQTHALLPDGVHVFDSGDWSKKPARPFPQQLLGVVAALPTGDAAGERALFLARQVKRPGEPMWNWLELAVIDPRRAGEDPRKDATSYLAAGTGTVFARTDWSGNATWMSLNAEPFFGDHQHLDQGHFEVVRGGDYLVLDPGDYGSYATMSHNTILVDDRHENLRWSPNQQIYSKDSQIARFDDEGGVVVAEAEFAGAYNPDDYPRYHPQRSVIRAERELVFSRNVIGGIGAPGAARIVIYDRMTVTKPTYGVTWIAHAMTTPETGPGSTRIQTGGSSATIQTVIPLNVTARLLKEPTVRGGSDPYTRNEVAEGISSTRIEVASPRGGTERRFLNAIVVASSGDKAPQAVRVEGEEVDGVAIDNEVYVFVSAGPQKSASALSYAYVPGGASLHVVVGLARGTRYTVAASAKDGRCRVAFTPGGVSAASAAGVLRIKLAGCALAK
jgi:hypothetical protein